MLFFDAFTRFGPVQHAHPDMPWTFQQMTAELAHCSISGALVTSSAQTLYDGMLENRRLSEALAAHPHLFAIWNVFPHWTGEMPEPAELLEEMRRHDVRCVQLHPKTNAWSLLSASSQPLLRALQDTRTLTVLDLTGEVHISEVEALCSRYPDLPVHLRGATWGQVRQVVPLLLAHKNLHLSFTHFQVNEGLEHLVDLGCEDQLLFASHAPEMSAGAHRAYIDWSPLPEPVRAKIAGGNLTRLLHGQCPPRETHNADEDALMAACRAGQPLPCHVLDMHAHILDEGLNGAGGGYTMWNGGPKGVHDLGRRMGVDGIGLMSWNGTVGVHAEQGNACVRAALDAYPDYFWGLATFDVMHESADTMRAQMAATYADRRFLGLKPYPMYGIRYDDPRYDCWWEFGNAHKLYCGLHPTLWLQTPEFVSICERFPDLTVVGYHVGGSYAYAERCVEVAQRFPNFHCEPTLTPVTGGIIDYLAAGCGVDRLMYGSDLPMRDPRQQLGWIVFSRLSLEQKRQVLGGNAQRILDRARAAQAGR